MGVKRWPGGSREEWAAVQKKTPPPLWLPLLQLTGWQGGWYIRGACFSLRRQALTPPQGLAMFKRKGIPFFLVPLAAWVALTASVSPLSAQLPGTGTSAASGSAAGNLPFWMKNASGSSVAGSAAQGMPGATLGAGSVMPAASAYNQWAQYGITNPVTLPWGGIPSASQSVTDLLQYYNLQSSQISNFPEAAKLLEQAKQAAGKSATEQKPQETGQQAAAAVPQLKIFGYDFFDRSEAGFQPIVNQSAPAEYPLGPGDSLRTVFTSPTGQETDILVQVDASGRVHVPGVGFVKVSGHTIADAQAAIGREVRARFPSIRTQASVVMIRPIQVFVIGEVKRPGAYTLPGLSTLLNALYSAGGPGEAGSLRTITLSRNKKTIAQVDLYDLLIDGKREKDISLQSGDSIFVPALGPTVSVEGEVRRQAIYEILPGTSVRAALGMAGGANGTAALSNVRIERIEGASRKFLVDLSLASPKSPDWEFPVQNGDRLIVMPVLDYADNQVEIFGHVRRPGKFELSQGMTLSQLVKRAEGFTNEEIYLDRASILRTHDDGSNEVLSANLGQAMAGQADQDIALKPKDRVLVYTRQEASSLNRVVQIAGEVSRPGPYDRRDGMRLRDLIIVAGGVKPEAQGAVEVARTQAATGVTTILNVDLSRAMAGVDTDNILLADGDHVSIRSPREARATAEVVEVSGEVKFPGKYALLTRNERLSSLVARAGGLTSDAFPEGTVFIRQAPVMLAQHQIEAAAEIQQGMKALRDQIRDLEFAKYGIAPKEPEAVSVPAAAASTPAASVATAAQGVAQAASQQTTSQGVPVSKAVLGPGRTVENVTQTARLPVNVVDALEKPGSEQDVPMEDGDSVTIPRKPLVVSVAGAVVNPAVVVFREGRKVDEYVRVVGGFARDADRKNTVVVRANGEVVRQREAGMVKLGDIIIVPSKAMAAPRTGWDSVSDFAKVLGNLAVAVAVVTR